MGYIGQTRTKFSSPDKFNAVTNTTFPNYTIKQIMSLFWRSFINITDSNKHTDGRR